MRWRCFSFERRVLNVREDDRDAVSGVGLRLELDACADAIVKSPLANEGAVEGADWFIEYLSQTPP